MRRTQLYLEDDLWNALHTLARDERTTLSELVRRAARERYLGDFDVRRKAMRAFVGARPKSAGAEESVRELRRGSRMDRLGEK
jgi:hypothetical protein